MDKPATKKGEWTTSVWISALLGVLFLALGGVLLARDKMITAIGPFQLRSESPPHSAPPDTTPTASTAQEPND